MLPWGLDGIGGVDAFTRNVGRKCTFKYAFPILEGFALVLAATIITPVPLGVDFFFHLEVAKVWASGGNGMFSEIVMRINRFPYPPLFHLLLVPSIWLGDPYVFGRILQVILFSGSLALVVKLVKRYDGERAALFSGLLLLSNVAFVDSAIQARPQSLVILLMPVLLMAYLEDHPWPFALIGLAMFHTHGLAGLSMIYSLTFKKWAKDGRWGTALTVAGILAVPLLVISIWYMGGALTTWAGATESAQERALRSEPFGFTLAYMGPLLLGFPCLIKALKNWRTESEYVKAISTMLLGSMVMFPIWGDRWLQYSAIPLACLGADWLSKRKGRQLTVAYILVAFFFVLYQANYWWVSATGNWFTPGQNTW